MDNSESELSGVAPPPPKRTKFGVLLTSIYLLIVVGIAACHWRTMIDLTPDEWGSYLSGIFGPVAFLWLVLGFFQQGDELRYSAQALWLQGQELKNSVEQQRALVEATRQQIEFEKSTLADERSETERRSQPIFFPAYGGTSAGGAPHTRQHLIVTDNTGEECTDAKLIFNGQVVTRMPLLSKGHSIQGWATLPVDSKIDGKVLEFCYIDKLNVSRSQKFTYDGSQFIRLD